ncbi:hypothetical protein LPTSP4_32120 [Leptospira ryugenii]|uniref:Outer membrane protein n=1 Tax=Leptospira ryugenii TaxID=1917863 RepID=A0A2P2E4A5_9LEPT|nr:hypothetical protein [Leptospira ryugenii]GBF51674.1 hypothetical protein LPTSP4_32120 [Leptospira ryugenii]
MKSLSQFLIFSMLFLSPVLFAHHTGSSDSPIATARFVDPFTGKREKPANYLVLTQDYYQSTRENSHLFTTTAFVEMNFFDGRFSLNGSVPWNYYQQRNREDAARIGKSYLGFKYQPFFDLDKPYFFVIEGSVGFPSGPDTDRFTGGDYYAGTGFLKLGYLYEKWSFVVKAGGIRPLTRPQPNNLQDNDGIPYYLRRPSEAPPEPNYLYKNTGIASGYISYYLRPEITLFSGILYRNPYNGVEYSNNKDKANPFYFTEASAGFSWNLSEKYNMSLTYRYPLQRDRDYRLYQSAWTFAFSMEWGSD